MSGECRRCLVAKGHEALRAHGYRAAIDCCASCKHTKGDLLDLVSMAAQGYVLTCYRKRVITDNGPPRWGFFADVHPLGICDKFEE